MPKKKTKTEGGANTKYPRKMPYEMHPGLHSKVSKNENVNFRDSDLKKAEGFPNMYPENFNAARVAAVKAGKDSFNVGGKEFKVTSKAGAEMHGKPHMDHGPGMFNIGGVLGMTKAGQLANQGFKKRKKLRGIGGMFNIGANSPFKYDR